MWNRTHELHLVQFRAFVVRLYYSTIVQWVVRYIHHQYAVLKNVDVTVDSVRPFSARRKASAHAWVWNRTNELHLVQFRASNIRLCYCTKVQWVIKHKKHQHTILKNVDETVDTVRSHRQQVLMHECETDLMHRSLRATFIGYAMRQIKHCTETNWPAVRCFELWCDARAYFSCLFLLFLAWFAAAAWVSNGIADLPRCVFFLDRSRGPYDNLPLSVPSAWRKMLCFLFFLLATWVLCVHLCVLSILHTCTEGALAAAGL